MRGFTLIELIIVVAIIGVMTSVAVIAATQWGPRFRLNSAESAVVNMVRKSKAEAIKSRQDTNLSFTSSSISWSCAGESETKNLEHITLDSWSHTSPGYDPRGGLIDGSGSTLGANATISFSNEAGSCTVTLQPYGAGISSQCNI